MEKQIAQAVDQQPDSAADAFVELADMQLAVVGGGIGDTAI